MHREQKQIKRLFAKLKIEPRRKFPLFRQKLDAPEAPGVYVIYDQYGKIEHVGESTSIAGRLRGHMSNASSYVNKSLEGDGTRLRGIFWFRCLPVGNRRRRMLLQAFTIGHLCPRHIGDRAPQSK